MDDDNRDAIEISSRQIPTDERWTMMIPHTTSWLHWLVVMALAAVVAYFTTTSAIQVEMATLKATEASHFAELLRRLDQVAIDIRDVRSGGR